MERIRRVAKLDSVRVAVRQFGMTTHPMVTVFRNRDVFGSEDSVIHCQDYPHASPASVERLKRWVNAKQASGSKVWHECGHGSAAGVIWYFVDTETLR